MFKILSFDGGGIRGLLSAVLLQRLNLNTFDLVAGTSTGGIIALALAYGLPISEIINIYSTQGSNIFDDTWMHDLKDLFGLIGAKYDNQKLFNILTSYFGNTTLSNLKNKVVVPTFNLHATNPDRWEPYIMHNLSTTIEDPTIVEAAMRTSAAPTYFPSWKLFIDGGVAINNPASISMAQAVDSGIDFDDIVILSIGTGLNFSYLSGSDLDFGDAQWIQPLIQLLLDNNDTISGMQCRMMLKDRYWRLNPILNSKIALDDYSKTSELINIANTFDLSGTKDWIQKYWI